MAQFTPKKLDKNAINGGNRFNKGDGFSEAVFNDPIEAILYLQENGGGGSETDFNLKNSVGKGGVQQVYGTDDDQFSVAYQVGSVALGGKTQAGLTQEEFLAKYPTGVDGTERTWEESYAFATSFGDLTRARGRASIAGGSASEANGYNAGSFGRHCVVDANNSYAFGFELISKHSNNQIVIGKYNLNKDYSIFEVGNGTETKRSNAIEVDKNGRIYCYLTDAGKNTNWGGDILTRDEVKEYLKDKVSKTDYATGDVAGIVRVRKDRGIAINGAGVSQGLIELVPAIEDEKVKELTNRAWYKPITAGILDKAIVVGISTNTITLSEEEKTSALEWLGAVKKATQANLIYGTTTNYAVSFKPMGYAIPRYSTKDNLKTSTPVDDNDCTPKKYVDDKIAELLARIEALESK